jgi:beta-glucosidase
MTLNYFHRAINISNTGRLSLFSLSGGCFFMLYTHTHNSSRHGLSYTTFSFANLQLSEPVVSSDAFSLKVSVEVTNTGAVAGSEVAQFYVTLPTTSDLTHPEMQLKGFKKVELAPGQSEILEITLDKYAVSYWDDRFTTWVVEAGEYVVHAGSASDKLGLQAAFSLQKGFEWRGL